GGPRETWWAPFDNRPPVSLSGAQPDYVPRALLYPFVEKNPVVFHCPQSDRHNPLQVDYAWSGITLGPEGRRLIDIPRGSSNPGPDFPLMTERAKHRPLSPCVVAGPTCDSADVVARDQLLPDLEIGELLLVPSMGAYTSASASNFNGLGPARSVAVR